MLNLLYLRYILNNKYIEEGELQGAVMIPSKEAKQLTYELLENHFIQLQELRKVTLASILCENLDEVYMVQPDVFIAADPYLNSPVTCDVFPR